MYFPSLYCVCFVRLSIKLINSEQNYTFLNLLQNDNQ